MTPQKAVVHVVDDDVSFRIAVGRMLDAAGYSVRLYASAGDFLLTENRSREYGCIILDLQMPGPSGLDLHEALTARGEHLPVVFLSAYGDIPTTVKAIKRGAIDFLTKPVDRVTLLAAIESALAHDRQERGRLHEVQVLAERFTALSPRERDVLGLVVAGRLNKQIADDLHMAERTVKAHRAHAMAKLNARTLAELVTIVRSIEQHAGSVRNVRP